MALNSSVVSLPVISQISSEDDETTEVVKDKTRLCLLCNLKQFLVILLLVGNPETNLIDEQAITSRHGGRTDFT